MNKFNIDETLDKNIDFAVEKICIGCSMLEKLFKDYGYDLDILDLYVSTIVNADALKERLNIKNKLNKFINQIYGDPFNRKEL